MAMSDVVGQLRQLENMDEVGRQINAAGYAQLNEAVAQMLSYGEVRARDVSVMAYAKAMVATCPEYRHMLDHTMDSLVRTGFFTRSNTAGKGGVRVYDSSYILTPAFAKSPEAMGVLRAIRDLSARTAAAGKKRYEEALASLLSQVGDSPLSIADFKSGKPGRILIQVPDETTGDRTFKGGWILVESVDGKVGVVDSVGYIQKPCDEMVAAGIYFPVDQIGAANRSSSSGFRMGIFTTQSSSVSFWPWRRSRRSWKPTRLRRHRQRPGRSRRLSR